MIWKDMLGHCWYGGKLVKQLQSQKIQGVEKLLKSLQNIGANISIKVHSLHSQLDKFPDNCSNVRDEQGEKFHQDIKTIEEHNQRWWDKQMMVDYSWSIKRGLNNIEHDRQLGKRKSLS